MIIIFSRHGRDLPPQNPREMPLAHHSGKLVLQLATLLHRALPRGHELRQPRIERLLDLGRFLLDLRRFRLLDDLRDQRSAA